MKERNARHAIRAIALYLGLLARPPVWGMEAPEEIIVTGEQTLTQLQIKIELAQDRMFGLFNELNDDDRYDIQCTVETRTGTLISQRVCLPEFLRKAIEVEARAFLAGVQGTNEEGGVSGTSAAHTAPPQSEINYRYPILKEKMNTLVGENAEFAEAVAEHHELIEEMERRTSSSIHE